MLGTNRGAATCNKGYPLDRGAWLGYVTVGATGIWKKIREICTSPNSNTKAKTRSLYAKFICDHNFFAFKTWRKEVNFPWVNSWTRERDSNYNLTWSVIVAANINRIPLNFIIFCFPARPPDVCFIGMECMLWDEKLLSFDSSLVLQMTLRETRWILKTACIFVEFCTSALFVGWQRWTHWRFPSPR